MVVLIPARAGSVRVPGKALKELGGKPLLVWTVESALGLGPSATVVVASEDADILKVGIQAGAHGWVRPRYTATADAPDLTWLRLALAQYSYEQLFVVRRPTSPFITLATMERAIDDFLAVPEATAMRAMRRVAEHPNKMWERRGCWMTPVMKGAAYSKGLLEIEPWSMPTQQLASVYTQTAGLEIIRRSTLEADSLTGDKLLPLFLDGDEALDINTPEDWARAEAICARHAT